VTKTSENPAAAAISRRALWLERQARVGILRNPNAPPRPPPRKAALMGKWPRLRSGRRPLSDINPATEPPEPRAAEQPAGRPAMRPAGTGQAIEADNALPNDTDLARMMRQASTGGQSSFVPPLPIATNSSTATGANATRRGPSARGTLPEGAHEDRPAPIARPRFGMAAPATRALVLLGGFGFLFAVALFAVAP